MPSLEGQATSSIADDHTTSDCVYIHAAKVGTRFEVIDPIRQGVNARFSAYERSVAAGLTVGVLSPSQARQKLMRSKLAAWLRAT